MFQVSYILLSSLIHERPSMLAFTFQQALFLLQKSYMAK